MKTKREVLETYKEYAFCAGIDCKECPFNKVGEECDIGRNLIKLGAEIMLENGNIEMKEMNIDALLEDYMNNPKWAGKIFMQDEKTCYIDGLIAGAKEMQEENEQLKAQIEKMKSCANCKYGNQGFPDYNRECYFCDIDRCICAVTGNKMTWDEKCDEWGLAE